MLLGTFYRSDVSAFVQKAVVAHIPKFDPPLRSDVAFAGIMSFLECEPSPFPTDIILLLRLSRVSTRGMLLHCSLRNTPRGCLRLSSIQNYEKSSIEYAWSVHVMFRKVPKTSFTIPNSHAKSKYWDILNYIDIYTSNKYSFPQTHWIRRVTQQNPMMR